MKKIIIVWQNNNWTKITFPFLVDFPRPLISDNSFCCNQGFNLVFEVWPAGASPPWYRTRIRAPPSPVCPIPERILVKPHGVVSDIYYVKTIGYTWRTVPKSLGNNFCLHVYFLDLYWAPFTSCRLILRRGSHEH